MAAPACSDGSLGRLAFSQACRDLSDLARAHVATSTDGYLRPGELLEEAAGLVAGAEQALRMAVVAERLRGTSWAQIGEALGVTRQSAHERYASFEHEVRRALLFPDRAGEAGALGWWAVPDGLEDPERTARRLDEWELRHREHTDPERGETAVSAGLQPRRMLDETGAVIELGTLLLDDRLPAGVSRERAERELLVGRAHRFLALCEDTAVAANESHDREAERARIFDSAQTLAGALVDGDGSERWEPLRDLILAGLEAGGMRHTADSAALRTASGELAAAALDARRRAGQRPTRRVLIAPTHHNRR